MVVLYFSCNFDVVVRRGEPCLPMLPSWLEVRTALLSRYMFILAYFIGSSCGASQRLVTTKHVACLCGPLTLSFFKGWHEEQVCSLKPSWRYCLTCFLIVPIAGSVLQIFHRPLHLSVSPPVKLVCSLYQMKEVSSPQKKPVYFLDRWKLLILFFALTTRKMKAKLMYTRNNFFIVLPGLFCDLSKSLGSALACVA